jgi:transcriptional regulator with XRE-family HTH domain
MNTHLEDNDKRRPYKAFGLRLAELRLKAGIPSQSDLAVRMGCKQQTVNRWEAGLSRPRDKQIPLLAGILGADTDELMKATGYAAPAAVTSFDQPFPVDRLTPESFERFCHHLLEQFYPEAEVHRVGAQGHTQDGVDIEAVFSDKTRYGFQCKRVGEFGPQKVHAAVAMYPGPAEKKFLLLTRVASPQAREAMRQHDGWDIWDKEDISLRIRKLSKHEQRRLVDIFFPRQHLALLGETETSPWQTAEEFFAPFTDRQRGAFRHTWPLVGRVDEIRQLTQGLSDTQVRVVMLIGAGGAGKSRVLKETIETYAPSHRTAVVCFLSPTEEATSKNLEELGTGDKVLVVDDAHDRADLPLLFQYAARPASKTKLLLSFRPYGLDYIKSQAGNFALAGDSTLEVILPPLAAAQSIELAKEALAELGGPTEAAADLAHVTRDCPLATVIGAQVLAKDRRQVELIKSEDAFRTIILGKFRDIIAGEIGSRADTELIQRLLRVLALVQPFRPEDETIAVLVHAVEGLAPHDTNRLIRSLNDAGVLFKRGGQFRLSPDLLADHIIEATCVGLGHLSTGYAEKVFAAAGDQYIEHVLLNLGKLDWRLANGNPTNSRLLDGIWGQLAPSSEYGDLHMKAVTAVAYFQPERALAFAERLISDGKNLRDLPELLKYAAYTYKCVRRACDCLWELGKGDARDLNPHPAHAIRILSELCAVRPNKSLQYNQAIVDFGLSLLDRDDVWAHRYSPFDILNGILQPEGQTTEARGRNLAIKNFRVNPDAVAALRAKVVDAVIRTLSHRNVKAAVLAAQCLRKALHYPMDATDEARQRWTAEFAQTLGKIESAVEPGSIDQLVLIEVARAISWHARYGLDETRVASRRILDSLPVSLEFRTLLALVDSNGQIIERHADYQKRLDEWNEYLTSVTADLLRAYSDGETLRATIERHMVHIRLYYPGASSSPYGLYWRLITASPALARATVDDALAHHTSSTSQFVAMALAKIVQENRVEGISYMTRFLESGSRDLSAAVGETFSRFGPQDMPLRPEEMTMLRQILGAGDERIARPAVGAVRVVAKDDQKLAIDLLKCVDIGISSELADHVFMNFVADNGGLFGSVTAEDVSLFLKKLMPLSELNGYWIETFLSAVSKTHGACLAEFFMDRVGHAAAAGDWNYRPCNYGPYGNVPLRFRESPDFGSLLRRVSDWMKSRDDFLFGERSAQLFDTMFKPLDDVLVAGLQGWADAATEVDIQTISKILGQAHPTFVFEQRDFVVRFLERARQFGREAIDGAISATFGSAIGGIRYGTPGEPFPEDVAMKQEAAEAMAKIPRFSAAFVLYERIARHADWSIGTTIRDDERFEE